MNFMLDAVFSAILGVLNQIIKSYNTIEVNVEKIGKSFVDLTNIVQNGKDGTTILIRMYNKNKKTTTKMSVQIICFHFIF